MVTQGYEVILPILDGEGRSLGKELPVPPHTAPQAALQAMMV